jgi:hypothetical protein
MGIRDEAKAMRRRHGSPSRLALLLADLDGEEYDELVALVWDDTHISGRAVAATLNKHFPNHGPFTDQQIRNHRAGPRL